MPPDESKLFNATPEYLRRFSELHSTAGKAFNAMADALERKDPRAYGIALRELEKLGQWQEMGAGAVVGASA